MPIYLNGGSNPTSVTYNGTSLDYAYATVNGISAPYAVWERPNIAPSTLSTISITLSNGSTLHLNDMVRQGSALIVDGNNTYNGSVYSGMMSAQMYFESGYQTSTYQVDETAGVPTSSSNITSITGVPSGFTFYQARQAWSSSRTIAFDVYKTTGYVLRPEDLEVMNLQARVEVYSLVAFVQIKGPGHGWPIVTRTDGWISQTYPTELLLKHS